MAYVKSSLIPQGILDMIAINNAEEGAICSFNTDLSMGMYECICQINATGGNGTPSSPIPIVGHSELNLVRCGKNFFDKTATNVANGYVANSWLSDNNTVVPDTDCNISEYIPIVANSDFYIVGTKFGNPAICFYDINKTFISGEKYNYRTEFAFTTPPNTAYLRFSIIKENIDSTQIELDSAATPYEPYNGTSYLVQFNQTVYGGEYDANTGKIRITQGMVDLSNLTQTSVSGGRAWRCRIEGAKIITSGATVPNIKGEQYTPVSANAYNFVTGTAYQNVNLDYFEFCNNDSVNPATGKVVYELATPIEIDVSELSVDTIVGVNNMFHDCNGTTKGKFFETVGHNVLK